MREINRREFVKSLAALGAAALSGGGGAAAALLKPPGRAEAGPETAETAPLNPDSFFIPPELQVPHATPEGERWMLSHNGVVAFFRGGEELWNYVGSLGYSPAETVEIVERCNKRRLAFFQFVQNRNRTGRFWDHPGNFVAWHFYQEAIAWPSAQPILESAYLPPQVRTWTGRLGELTLERLISLVGRENALDGQVLFGPVEEMWKKGKITPELLEAIKDTVASGLNEMAYVAFGEDGDTDIDDLPDVGSAEFSFRMASRRIMSLDQTSKLPVIAIEETPLEFPTPHRRDRDSHVSFVTFWDGNGDIVVVMIDRGKMSVNKVDGNGGCGNICAFWVVKGEEVPYGDEMEKEKPPEKYVPHCGQKGNEDEPQTEESDRGSGQTSNGGGGSGR